MKKLSLLTIIAFLAGWISATAASYSVRIQVDNAANVRMSGSAGYGAVIDLADGMNTITFDEADNPICIEPANNASITSVTFNGNSQNAGGDGKYRLGITSNSFIDITTSGTGDDVTENLRASFWNYGPYPDSFTITYGEDQSGTIGTTLTIAKGSVVTIAPLAGYKVTEVSEWTNNNPITQNADGTWSVTVETQDAFFSVYTDMADDAVKFTVNADFAGNVDVTIGNDNRKATLTNGKETTVIALPEMQPLTFTPTEGATIVEVTRNGTRINPSGDGVIRSEFANEDQFTIVTKGRQISATLTSFDGSADLDAYSFTLAGEPLEATGREYSFNANLGDRLIATPVGANTLSYLFGQGTQDLRDLQKPAQGVLLTADNASVSVMGDQAKGVNIIVDNHTRVIVKQSNGRGEALSLQDGINTFNLSDLKNALTIDATEGSMITGVKYNSRTLEPSADGRYLVNVSDENCSITISTESVVTAYNVTFAITGNASSLTATVDGEPIDLTASNATVKPGAVLKFNATGKNRIASINAGENTVTENEETGEFSIVINHDCMISVIVEEMTAQEGFAIVSFDCKSPLVTISEYTTDNDNQPQFVRALSPTRAYEVKIGNEIRISTITTSLYFESVKINGAEVSHKDGDSDKLYRVTIEGESEITVTTVSKTQVSGDTVYDPDNHTVIGRLLIKDGDELVSNYHAALGETVEFVAQPTVGYKFESIKCIYPTSMQLEGNTYTITQSDIDNEIVLFGATFVKDEENPSCVVRGNKTVISTSEGQEVVGEVLLNNNGTAVSEIVLPVGEKVQLLPYHNVEYKFVKFVLWYNNDIEVGEVDTERNIFVYTVNPDHADTTNVIELAGVFVKNDAGIDGTTAPASLSYDTALCRLSSNSPVTVYNINAVAVMQAEAGEHSLSHLSDGIYVAISGGNVLKFVKK